MAKIFLTHTPDMLANYYGPRALAELRKLGDVRLNETPYVLDAAALAQAARGCEIVVSDRQTPGPAGFFRQAADCVAFLRVAIDIRNIDVEAASREGITNFPSGSSFKTNSCPTSPGGAVRGAVAVVLGSKSPVPLNCPTVMTCPHGSTAMRVPYDSFELP